MGKYEAKGTGLSDPATRKRIYTLALVIFGAIVAAAITFGLITQDQVTQFIALLGWAVAAVAGIGGMLQSVLAKKNVDPPNE